VTGGGSFFSQHSFSLHFGLERETSVDQIVVEWPSGKMSRLSNLSANQKVTIVETPFAAVPAKLF
jgi:hypothetical protein